MPYCQHCGAGLSEDANFCPACGTRVLSEYEPVEKHYAFKTSGKPEVIVMNAAPGSVKVKSGSEKEVTVNLDLRVPEDLDCSVLQDGNVITVNCRAKGGFWGWPSYIFRTGPKANISVSVPEEADLDLETRAGRVTVDGVRGMIVVESSAGSMNIRNCEGTVKVRTRAGSVNLSDVNGIVTARSSAGKIKFSGDLSDGESWFKTSVGSIDITLQGQPDLTVEASTSLGSVRCIPELSDSRYRRNWYTGRIGSGKGRLIAETKTGSIKIRH